MRIDAFGFHRRLQITTQGLGQHQWQAGRGSLEDVQRQADLRTQAGEEEHV